MMQLKSYQPRVPLLLAMWTYLLMGALFGLAGKMKNYLIIISPRIRSHFAQITATILYVQLA